jgi:hypothetical protein
MTPSGPATAGPDGPSPTPRNLRGFLDAFKAVLVSGASCEPLREEAVSGEGARALTHCEDFA